MKIIKDIIKYSNRFISNLDKAAKNTLVTKLPISPGISQGEVIEAENECTTGAVVEGSWVAEEISKMQAAIDQIERKYNMPKNLPEERMQYNWFFANQDARHCPKCGHAFDKVVQRARYCPQCESYLHVRYGHLLSDEDSERFRKVNQAIIFSRLFGPNRINEVRIFASNGADDVAKQVIHDFYEEMSRIIDVLND